MPRTTLLFVASLLSLQSLAQKTELILDRVHPVIANDSHGDSIRKYFKTTFSGSGHQGLRICTFTSNRLNVAYGRVKEKIPALKNVFQPGSVLELPVNSYSADYPIPIFDSTGIIVTVNGINAENKNRYQFRVLDDKQKVLLDWTTPKLFTPSYLMTRIAKPNEIDTTTAYLGQFKTNFGHGISIEVREQAKPGLLSASLSAFWVPWNPRVLGVFPFAQLPEFLSVFKEQWRSPFESDASVDWRNDTVLKLRHDFRHDENNLILLLDDKVADDRLIEYNLVNGSDSTGWRPNALTLNLLKLENLAPGQYSLKLRYAIQREQVYIYPFLVRAAWYQTPWARTGLVILSVMAVGFVILMLRSRRQVRKLSEQETARKLVQTELKSIRSQFNPHFVFNALSSIRGLIARNDNEAAAKYLGEFSKLMRDSLKAGGTEFVSISTEVNLLENYLELEKLRFGFHYHLNVAKTLDVNALEIPGLLLQPLVENAVKHGISGLREHGKLVIDFDPVANDLRACISDNGKGFGEEDTEGFGLQLTRDRIKLLNQTLNGQEIHLGIARENDLTQVTVTFKNWLI